MELFVFISIAAFIYLFLQVNSLKDRVEFLEGKAGNKRSKKSDHVEIEEKDERREKVDKHGRGWFKAFLQWFAEDWLMKVGALLVLMAGAWFVRYAFLNDWIGEVGRITLGILFGLGVLVWGYVLIKKKPIPAQVLVILGASLVLISLFAGQDFYDFYTPATTLFLMGLVVAVLAVLSITEKMLSFAIAFLLAGSIVPFFAGFELYGGTDNAFLISSYLFLLSLGTFVVVNLRSWRPLLLLTMFAVFFYSLGLDVFRPLDDLATWVFITAFYALFALSAGIAVLRAKKLIITDIFTAAVVVFLAIVWVEEFVPENWQSIALAAATIFAILVNYGMYRMGAPRTVVYLKGAMAVALLGAATIYEVNEEALAIILGLEALAILAMIWHFFKDQKALSWASLLLVFPGLLALDAADGYGLRQGDALFHIDFWTLLIVSAIFGLASLMMRKSPITRIILDVIATFFAFILIWNFLEALFESENLAHGAALTIYTLVGVGLMWEGLRSNHNAVRIFGMSIMGLVALRLVFVEVWDMSLVGRVVTFVTIGFLFILTAFFNKSKKH